MRLSRKLPCHLLFAGIILVLSSISTISTSQAQNNKLGYNRKAWQYRSYKADSNIGYYTQKRCDKIDIDHLVSLYDAHESGGYQWQAEKKKLFANDRDNHKPACASVNRSKGNATPALFFNRANDGKGVDYDIVTKCQYLDIYKQIKQKYQLSFNNNQHDVLALCS